VQAAGVAPRVNDYNERGFGGSYLQFNTRNGVRCNTRMAYLDSAMGRANLTIKTGALVSRVLLEGQRAVGVRARINGIEGDFRARREVILCGGAFNSPHCFCCPASAGTTCWLPPGCRWCTSCRWWART
jgi:choline dehydrogenase-like flavoprotein